MLVSRRTLPAQFIDPLAAFLDSFQHRLGVLLGETSERSGENGFPPFPADRFEPPDEIGGLFQLFRRQRLVSSRASPW
jgi:hypothetical protein